jgi:hypothetical protein
METVYQRAHATQEARLVLDLQASLADSDVDVTMTVRSREEIPRDSLGWPMVFWRRFAGSMPDFPDIADCG